MESRSKYSSRDEQETTNQEQRNTMTDIQLYTKLSGLPANLKVEVEDFIDFLLNKKKKNVIRTNKRVPGKAKGLIKMKDNFDDPIEGFNDYLK